MSVIGWIIMIVVVIPLIVLLLWAILRSSFIKVPSGSIGLILVKGKATDKALLPGPHFVAALRRHMVEEYPSVEQVFRTDGRGTDESSGPATSSPPVLVMLGDRTTVSLDVTVRYQIIPEQLKLLHERFGPKGVADLVRDETTRALRNVLGHPDVGVKNLLGKERQDTEADLFAALDLALAGEGIRLSRISLGVLDLGRTGEVLQAAARAGYEMEREEAEARTRLARARNDAELRDLLTAGTESAWRYREPDLLGDLSHRKLMVSLALPTGRIEPGSGPATTAERAGRTEVAADATATGPTSDVPATGDTGPEASA